LTGAWGPVIAVLAAVLVGALIPVLVQLRATLRALEGTLVRSGSTLDEALHSTAAAARTIDSLGARLAKDGQLEKLVQELSALSRLALQLGDVGRVATAVGASVGPALAAGLAALRGDRPASSSGRPQAQVDFKHIHPQSRKWGQA
jgi:hypothetical protein